MSNLESIPDAFGLGGAWVEKGGSHWMTPEALGPREVTEIMNARDGRFITITATELADHDGIRMDHHWDLDGELLTFTFTFQDNKIDSIYDLCEAANWIEREIHEYFAVDFIGREYEPLFLREGDKPGVNLREEDE